MAANSRIEWTDHTFNPWWGCTKVSPACDHCYAEAWAKRTGHSVWGAKSSRRFLSDAYWKQPLKWDREAAESGCRKRVFCASMADVFEWKKELTPWRNKLWELIDSTPNLDWLLLTKRPHLANRMNPWGTSWPLNVWLGTTAEDQKWVNKRLPHLANSSANIRFLSCEPLLGEIDLSPWLASGDVDWVITGGESGPNARPSDPTWFKAVRDQCERHAVPFHFKQWGDWAPMDTVQSNIIPSRVLNVEFSTPVARFGKKRSGRILDGQTWDGLPAMA